MRRLGQRLGGLTGAALLVAAVACGGGSISGSGGNPPGGGTGGSNPGTGGSNPGTGGTMPPIALECSQPAKGAPLLRLLTANELQTTLDAIFPEVKGKWSTSLPANSVSGYGFDNDASSTAGSQYVSGLLDTAQQVATALVGAPLANVLPCSTSSANRTCADTFLTKYGQRLFRRSLKSAEHDQYLAFFDSALAKSDFKTALKWMTIGLIQSPNAVYRSEIGAVAGDSRKLTPTEVATELAYTYTGTTPTDDLLSKAEAGTMGDPKAIAASLVNSDAGKEALQRFFSSYFGYGQVASIQRPNIQSFSAVAPDMVQETRHFVDEVIFQKKGGMKELLTANTTNPSKALASFYGFPAPSTDYASVTRPANRGLGILAQGSFLATHASSDASSPTKRGLFPFLRLFCQMKPSPPPNVPPIMPPAPGQQTTRQRYEVNHAQGSCGSCHKLFDPMGFGFEHFNEGGQFRDTESGLAINAAATYTPTFGAAPFSYTSQEELVTDLAAVPQVYQCSAFYLATFAFGSGESCLGASSVPDLQDGKIGIVDAFVNLAAEPHFQTRNVE